MKRLLLLEGVPTEYLANISENVYNFLNYFFVDFRTIDSFLYKYKKWSIGHNLFLKKSFLFVILCEINKTQHLSFFQLNFPSPMGFFQCFQYIVAVKVKFNFG